jgi:HEPN domain-containing protein
MPASPSKQARNRQAIPAGIDQIRQDWQGACSPGYPGGRVVNRAKDWIAQAERDLRHAEDSAEGGSHEWACFAAHQGAEKAVTALHLYLGQEAWGHVVAKLLRELPIDVPREFVERGSVLDNFYVPARYPNGHPEGAPFEHYGPRQSKEAIEDARAIFEFVGAEMAKPPRG